MYDLPCFVLFFFSFFFFFGGGNKLKYMRKGRKVKEEKMR